MRCCEGEVGLAEAPKRLRDTDGHRFPPMHGDEALRSDRLEEMRVLVLLSVMSLAASLFAADEKYTGPRPAKPDVPYLLHANKLVETEAAEAREQAGKKDMTYVISGAASPAKTPMAEPIFLILADKLNMNTLELYKLEVKGGNREITMATGKSRKGGPRPLKLTIQKVDDKLYRLEAGEGLENGQYSLSPSDSNKTFCFEVY